MTVPALVRRSAHAYNGAQAIHSNDPHDPGAPGSIQCRVRQCRIPTESPNIYLFDNAGRLLAQDGGPSGGVNLIWIAVGIGVIVVLLYTLVSLFFGWGKWRSSRQNIDMELEVGVRPRLDAFVREFAQRMKWDADSADRLCSAAEEAFMSLVRQDEGLADAAARQLRVAVHRDGDAAEMEFMAAPQGTNLEEQMGLIRDRDTPVTGRDLSLRLLRHYASSVSHRQYHAIDLLTVRVKGSR